MAAELEFAWFSDRHQDGVLENFPDVNTMEDEQILC